MAIKTIKALREDAETALATGVANREQLRSAVPALVALQNAERSMRLRLKETQSVIQALSEACSKYAHEHPEYVFDQTFSVSPIGVESGDVEIDGKTYHFSHGFEGFVRAEPGKQLTQDFLKSLPEGWAKSKLELDLTEMKRQHVTIEEAEEHGLARKFKDTWFEM
jgi:hypothetical protein